MVRGSFRIQAIAYVILILGAVSFVVPYAWLFLSSFKPTGQIMTDVWPTHWTLSNYTFLLGAAVNAGYPFARNVFNSVFIGIVDTAGVVLFGSMCGYALSRLSFGGRWILGKFVTFQIIFPGVMFVIPTYVLILRLHLLNSYSAVILPGLMSPWSVFLFAQFFKGIPDDLINSARVEGATDWQILYQIVLPLSKSIFALVALFTFTASWDTLLWPLIVIQSPTLMPLTPAVSMFALSEYSANNFIGAQMASAVVLTAPLLILYLSFRKLFIEGITLTSGMQI
ncbi:MAG: carbohydrate ABC transporter permease [Bacilli bacterium]